MSVSTVLFPMKRFPQGLTDDLCGVRCLETIYDFFEIPHPTPYFVRELALADELSFLPQLLRLCSRDGFHVIANISNPYVFDLSWKNLSNQELVEKLQQRYFHLKEQHWGRDTIEYILYLKEKNKISMRIISDALIRDCLQQKKIVLALVDNVIFHQRKRRYWDEEKQTYDPDDVRGGSDGHAVVVNGWDKQKGFHIVDPSQVQKYGIDGQYWVDPAILIAGVYTHSGEIGIIWK